MRRVALTLAALAAALTLAAPASAAPPTDAQTLRAITTVVAGAHRLIACGIPNGKASTPTATRCVTRNAWALYTPVRTLIYGLPARCRPSVPLTRFEKAASTYAADSAAAYIAPTNRSIANQGLVHYLALLQTLATVARTCTKAGS